MAEQIINIDRLEHTIELFGNFDENAKLISALTDILKSL